MEGASLSTTTPQVQDKCKKPKHEERPSGEPSGFVTSHDETASYIRYLEQRNKQLEDEHTLIELQRIREDRRLARKRPGDLTPVARQFVLEKVNQHLEGFLAKANRDKDLLRHMKNHYWARMHVCKAKIKILKRRLSKALKRRKRPDPLQILVEASLTEHST